MTCAGCGADVGADATKVCRICGKLISEGFQPLDVIRSSYGLQRRDLTVARAAEVDELFPRAGSAITETAWACTVYAMVPYLGILFVPLAVGIGSVGYFLDRGASRETVASSPLACVGVSLLLLAVQIFLWWLLYLIPEIGMLSR